MPTFSNKYLHKKQPQVKTKGLTGLEVCKFCVRIDTVRKGFREFGGGVIRYTEVANNVQGYETVLNIQFVLLDCSPLKASIAAHCQEWQNKFTSLLLEMFTTELHSLNDYLVTMGKRSLCACVLCACVCVCAHACVCMYVHVCLPLFVLLSHVGM